MPNFDLIERNRKFREKIWAENPQLFEELKQGQSPEIFLLACCDSRVSPHAITRASLGEIFVHRNIANQVVDEDESFSASLYYALYYLKVKKVVVKGHTMCGGIQAAWEGNQDEELRGWLKQIRKNLPDRAVQPCISLDEVSKKNVIKQVEHLMNHPIYKKYGENTEVEGYLYHMENGELERVYPVK